VFERFTEKARQVVVLAQDEARTLNHNYIGTEHLLLGLLRVEDGIAARALESIGVTLEDARAQVSRIIGTGEEAPAGQIPFTPRGKKVLELSLREAQALGSNHIGTEHILLGLARENEGVASRILFDSGAPADKVRAAVGKALGVRIPNGGTPLKGPLAEDWASSEITAVPPRVLGWVPAGVGLGILIGWLIWG
jgi:ATP-dependent Clp protease ATP-binding subunit ClpC